MQHMKLKLAAAVTAALLSTTAMADSWTITQDAIPTGDATNGTTITQTTTSGGSVQSMNAVNLGGDTTEKGKQIVGGTATNKLTFSQEGVASNSIQAANYANAGTIGATGTGNTLTQGYGGTNELILNQTTTAGTPAGGNTQAFNAVKTTGATGSVTSLIQSVGKTTAGTPDVTTNATKVTLDQNAASSNTQAVNAILDTASIVEATQDISPSVKLELKQRQGTGTQAANFAQADSSAKLTQTVKAGSEATNVTQTSTGKATQALNMAKVKAVTGADGVTQNVKGATTLGQGTAAIADPVTPAVPVGNGSVQAGNYLQNASTSSGAISKVTQKFGDTTHDVGLTQYSSGGDETNGKTIQAGNYIDMGSSTGALTEGVQKIENGIKAIALQQTGSSGGATQAGNLLKTSSGATGAAAIDQTISTTNTLTLSQSATGTALQAGNAVLVKGTGGGTATQNGTMTTLAMTQGNTGVTTSGSFQAINYVGSEL